MKDLYKPVFWCGFALSLSALYASSERFASGTELTLRKPVLMQINIGDATAEEVDSQSIDRNQFIAGESFIPEPSVSDIPVTIGAESLMLEDTAASPQNNQPAETSVFYTAAQEFLNQR